MISLELQLTQQMKKRFFTTLVALSAFLAVSADDYFDEQGGFSIRPYAGINVSSITVGSQEVSKSIIGFHGGVEAEYRLNYLFGISAGVGFSAEGGKMKYPMNSGFLAHGGDTEKWNYLEVPVLARIYLTEYLAFEGGVEPGVRLSAKEGSRDVKNKLKKTKWQIPVGVQGEYKNVTLNLRYHFCLGTVLSDETDFGVGGEKYKLQDFTSHLLTLTLGYRFRF